jgi:hypothetical protein
MKQIIIFYQGNQPDDQEGSKRIILWHDNWKKLSVARLWKSKQHVTVKTVTHTTIEELLEMVLSTGSVLRLCDEQWIYSC